MSWLEQRQRSTVGWQKNRGKPGPGLRAEDERGTGREHVGHRRHRRLARRIQARQLVRAEEERGWTPQPPAVRSTDPRFVERGPAIYREGGEQTAAGVAVFGCCTNA